MRGELHECKQMNKQQPRAGQKPAARHDVEEPKYESLKGCLILLLAVVAFLVISVIASYLTGMKPGV